MGMFDFPDKKDSVFSGEDWLTKMQQANPDLSDSSLTAIAPGGTFSPDAFNAANRGQGIFSGYGSKMQSPGDGGGWGWLNKTDPKTGMQTQGALNFGLSALQTGAGLYLGGKQLGLAEDQFAEAKRQFGKNFGAQVQTYNTNIEDRQRRRFMGAGGAEVSANPYQETSAYLDKNRLVG